MGNINLVQKESTKGKSTREAYGSAIVELGKINPKIVALEADVSKSTCSNLFASTFPERFFNIGIAEQMNY